MGILARKEQGCLADEDWLASFVIPNHHSFFHHRVYIDLPHKKLTYLRTVSQGQFGYIDLARYDTVERSVEVYVKRPILREAMNGWRTKRGDNAYPTTVYEPYVQQLVREGLARFGLPDHVPRVLEVFALHTGTVCFAMEEVEGAIVMDAYLHEAGLTPEKVSRRIKEILWHVAVMIWVMNHRLGVNHRDLKPSNFLIRRRAEAVVHEVEIEGLMPLPFTWTTTLHLSLIDFGFACVGSLDTHRAHLSLSTVYSRADPCPKDGRDMFLFLGYLYSDYYMRMTDELRQWFEEWLSIPGSDLCGFLRKDNDISKRWLYYLSGSESVFQLRSSPVTVLRALQGI
jgi:serine/threonine protein kinase